MMWKTAILILLLVSVMAIRRAEPAFVAPVMLDFETYPEGNWEFSGSGGTSHVSGGILTVDVPAGEYHEFILWDPND
jgi:hypothetical protein